MANHLIPAITQIPYRIFSNQICYSGQISHCFKSPGLWDNKAKSGMISVCHINRQKIL
ncbi:uncharacterized protein METZ01_LOCUS241598 [marine metagenome]|uniref:Uncharacterized protein n=1 Tax=marine metagenome TaxID=408172 RepID=A0A382HMX4_9ZZZZ